MVTVQTRGRDHHRRSVVDIWPWVTTMVGDDDGDNGDDSDDIVGDSVGSSLPLLLLLPMDNAVGVLDYKW